MTPHTHHNQASQQASGNWKQIERTQPQPGEWVQTRRGWERVGQ